MFRLIKNNAAANDGQVVLLLEVIRRGDAYNLNPQQTNISSNFGRGGFKRQKVRSFAIVTITGRSPWPPRNANYPGPLHFLQFPQARSCSVASTTGRVQNMPPFSIGDGRRQQSSLSSGPGLSTRLRQRPDLRGKL